MINELSFIPFSVTATTTVPNSKLLRMLHTTFFSAGWLEWLIFAMSRRNHKRYRQWSKKIINEWILWVVNLNFVRNHVQNALPNIITRHAKAEIIDGTSNIFLFDLFLAIYNCCFCCFSSSVFFLLCLEFLFEVSLCGFSELTNEFGILQTPASHRFHCIY